VDEEPEPNMFVEEETWLPEEWTLFFWEDFEEPEEDFEEEPVDFPPDLDEDVLELEAFMVDELEPPVVCA
jgi:hypothetical protein